MFRYNAFYKALGNLFYAIAATDGKVQAAEKDNIVELVRYFWKHIEDTKDQFSSDASNIILFQFDVNEAEYVNAKAAYKYFEDFFTAYAQDINHYLREKIMSSARKVADSTRRINHHELEMLMHLKQLLDSPVTVS